MTRFTRWIAVAALAAPLLSGCTRYVYEQDVYRPSAYVVQEVPYGHAKKHHDNGRGHAYGRHHHEDDD